MTGGGLKPSGIGADVGGPGQSTAVRMASILLVDDSATIRSLLRLELTKGGHAVAVAGCGNEAIRLLQAGAVDLVVTDIYMPNGDGIEVLTAMRRLPKRPAAIAMSSMTGDMNMLPSARALGAGVILTKPFPSGELLRRANELLNRVP